MVWIGDLAPLLMFVGIVAAIWAVLSMISNRNSKAVDRLARMSRPQTQSDLEDQNVIFLSKLLSLICYLFRSCMAKKKIVGSFKAEQNSFRILGLNDTVGHHD